MGLISFHGKQEIKDFYINRVHGHFLADEIVKGVYWKEGKGCGIGCTIHSGDHREYENQLGIPQWLARLEDRIFEGLPNQRAKLWPSEFLENINIGSDLSQVLIPMLIFIVKSARDKTKNKKVIAVIDGVLKELSKEKIDYEQLKIARAAAAANAAAYAAAAADAAAAAADAAAADAAAAAADAANAAYAAAAANAAYAAAYAADAAYAAAYARENEHIKFADKLLELIRDCK